uniref:Tc1-like transposase DDE domain-containing protein n=1 Tax=Astyanax mexicanus TaxID=7994 RepID=A0A3B1JK72_ASTMX
RKSTVLFNEDNFKLVLTLNKYTLYIANVVNDYSSCKCLLLVQYLHTQTGSNQSRKRSGRSRCTTKQEDKYIRVSSLRNRRLTGPQLASSLNSTRKTPVSTSTVKRVWGCFGAGKVGDLYRVKGILNKEGYHSILQRHAIPSGQRLIGANFVLQQDNDPKHTSKLCKNYLQQKQAAGILLVMEWPAQSPDLKAIELLWEQLDRMVRQKCPSNQSNLWELLLEAWGAISPAYLNKLTARMPKVCNAVIAANGGFFDESKV